jgi:mercuric reductase
MDIDMSKNKKIELNVSGMTCPSCAYHVSDALNSVEGVEEVNVPGWQANKAIVTANADVPETQLLEAVKGAGYSASVRPSLTAKVDSPETNLGSLKDNGGGDFDLLVIGAGSAGFAAAIKGTELGLRVGLVGEGTIGGTCVNIGCVPSKTLIRAAEAWHYAGNHPFKGVNTKQGSLDWKTLRQEKDDLVASLRQSKYIDVLSAYPKVTYIEGRGVFQKDGSLQVGGKPYHSERYIIATGASPTMLAVPGIEEAEPLNSTTLMDLEALPESLIVLGGRAIALELGQTMARLGVNVLILQRSSRLVPDHESEIGRAIKNYLEDEGLGIITGVQVERLSREGETRIVHARVMGQEQEFRADQILFALGRTANTYGMGLENVGVEMEENGSIIVDEYQQTSNPHIFAAGDVTTNPELVYIAATGGSLAAQNALADSRKPLDLSSLPVVIFTDPQIATVGLTVAEARRQGYEVKVSAIDLEYVPRALAARDTRGFIKLIADATSNRLLGAHVLASNGGEVIQTAAIAIKFGITIDDLTNTLFPYLTQVEGLKLAAIAFDKDVSMLSCCAG